MLLRIFDVGTVYTVKARPTGLTAAHYREPPWRLLTEMAGAVIARGRDQGASVEQVLATIWSAIEHAQIDTASDTSSEVL